MADYTTSTITTTTFDVTLPNPTNHVELEKALAVARGQWRAYYGDDPVFDDTFRIVGDEDGIHIQWDGPNSRVGGFQ